jgi:hypothetical protein
LTGAFAQQMEPKGNDLDMKIYYSSDKPVNIDVDKEIHNLSLGAILLPTGVSVYKHTNSKTLKFTNSNDYKDLKDFNLSIINKNDNPTHFMIFYNLAMSLDGNYSLSTRLNAVNLTQEDIKIKTTLSANNVEEVGLHSATVITLPPKGNTDIMLQYKYTGDKLEINDSTQKEFGQSLIAFELPKNSKVHKYDVHSTETIDLNTKNEWRELPVEVNLNINKKTTVIIIYSFNVKVDKKDLSMRIRINNKYSKKSVTSNGGLEYSFGTGYVLKSLPQGNHKIYIDFKSNSENKFNPSAKTSGEHVSLTVIEIE